ncbi:hypothetical protein RCL1_001716 [Eukaryota sp. TZLM3-RCL]
MIRSQLWFSEQAPVKDGKRQAVYSVSVSPDGTKFLAAMGTRLNVYDALDGSLLTSLKNHQKPIYTTSWSRNSVQFASGGGDKTVILYNQDLSPSFRYHHDSSIQALIFSPTSDVLVSCSNTDFGIYTPDCRSVPKTPLPSKPFCAAFSPDGHLFAIGLSSGVVTIRDAQGTETASISLSSPISSLVFSPHSDTYPDRLVIGTADMNLHVYSPTGISMIRSPKPLSSDPLSIRFSSDGVALFITGSDRKISMYTSDLIFIDHVAELSDWGWSVDIVPFQGETISGNFTVIVGSNDGVFSCFVVQIPVVHSLFDDLYIARNGLTGVTVTPITAPSLQFNLSLKDYVKKVAIGPKRLLAQTTKGISIYSLESNSEQGPSTKLLNLIDRQIDCSLLTVTSMNIISCKGDLLSCYTLDGSFVRNWQTPGIVRYVRLLHGPEGKESLLIGCKTGHVCRIFVNSYSVQTLLNHQVAIRCIDTTHDRLNLAVVDDNKRLTIYSGDSFKSIATYDDVTAACYNSKHANMLGFSTINGELKVSTANNYPQSHRVSGFIIGFLGNKLFLLQNNQIVGVEVPHSRSISSCLANGDLEAAITLARLGATSKDWYDIGYHALCSLDILKARRCFLRINDSKMLLLTDHIASKAKLSGFREIDLKNSIKKESIGQNSVSITEEMIALSHCLQAEVHAYLGKFSEAAEIYERIKKSNLTVEMYSDLCRWAECPNPTSEMLIRQGNWDLENGKYDSAIAMFKSAGDYVSAVKLLIKLNQSNNLIEFAKAIPDKEIEAIKIAAEFFSSFNFDHAICLFSRISDLKSILILHQTNGNWKDAFEILEKIGPSDAEFINLEKQLNAAYAASLADSEDFDSALNYMRKSGQSSEIKILIGDLIDCSVTEFRFLDTSYYCFLSFLEVQYEINSYNEQLNTETSQNNATNTNNLLEILAILREKSFGIFTSSLLYHTFSFIDQYTEDPFSILSNKDLFNVSCLFLNLLSSTAATSSPRGLSRTFALFALLKISKQLNCFKVTRICLDRLSKLILPPHWLAVVDSLSLHIRGIPYSDTDESFISCFRCGTSVCVLNESGDFCSNCTTPFYRSIKSFEILPLIEFYLEEGINDDDATYLIEQSIMIEARSPKRNQWRENVEDSVQTLSFDNYQEEVALEDSIDPFTRLLLTSDPSSPLIVDRSMLSLLSIWEVVIVKPNFEHERTRYFRVMVKNTRVCACQSCQSFYSEEEFESQKLLTGKCCFCRNPI